MTSEATTDKLILEGVGKRRVEADFSAGQVSSDGGAVLLREVDLLIGLTERLAACFIDHRNPELTEHTVAELLRQRVYALALGYEDLSDHEQLSRDPLLATVVGKVDVEGKSRRQKKDRGISLASPSTLGRVERTRAGATEETRYAKVVCDFDAVETLFLELTQERFASTPSLLISGRARGSNGGVVSLKVARGRHHHPRRQWFLS